jgi:hypothetical protein
MKKPESKIRLGARQREKPRAGAAEELERVWGEKRDARLRELKHWFGKAVKDFDVYGRPLADGDVSESDVAGEDVALGLQRAVAATGDPVFADALAALKSYGLAGGKPKGSHTAARKAVFGDHDRGYLKHMKWLIDNNVKATRVVRRIKEREALSKVKEEDRTTWSREHRLDDKTAIEIIEAERCQETSVREAAECVASEFFVPGKSFKTVVNALRERFSEWERSGFADDQNIEHGDVGYLVKVRPVEGCRVLFPGRRGPLPAGGAVVQFTGYWRGRFADGSIEISRQTDTPVIGEKTS